MWIPIHVASLCARWYHKCINSSSKWRLDEHDLLVNIFVIVTPAYANIIQHHLVRNVYVTLNAIGSFQCNLCSHWLIQILIT